MGGFRSMKAREMLRLLERELGYTVTRQVGSHRLLTAPGRPPVVFAYHDRQTLAPGQVRKLLVKDVRLSLDDAEALL